MTSSSILETVEIVSPKDSNKRLVINRTAYDPEKHTLWEEKDFIPAAEVAEEPKKRRGRPPKAKAEETTEEEKPSEELLTDTDDPGPIWGYKSDG